MCSALPITRLTSSRLLSWISPVLAFFCDAAAELLYTPKFTGGICAQGLHHSSSTFIVWLIVTFLPCPVSMALPPLKPPLTSFVTHIPTLTDAAFVLLPDLLVVQCKPNRTSSSTDSPVYPPNPIITIRISTMSLIPIPVPLHLSTTCHRRLHDPLTHHHLTTFTSIMDPDKEASLCSRPK